MDAERQIPRPRSAAIARQCRWRRCHAPARAAGDPLADFRIKAATATAYRVKAGDYIQVIDVAGRQCTDFQCFSARKLDRGLALPLDATVTGTLLGRLYPTPGPVQGLRA
jgi:uncharacterized protein YcgI (DUF1989 family)